MERAAGERENRRAAARDPFSIGQARHLVKDLFEPRAWIYWTDFLISFGVGLFCFWAVPRMGVVVADPLARRLLQGTAFTASCLLFYRSATFTHELVHLRAPFARSFSIAWNVLCGIPFLMPSFTYHTHARHHYRKLYATHGDGEYLSLGRGPRWKIVAYLLESLIVPVAAVLRFGILTPISWMNPRIRRFVYTHLSSMVIDPLFVRPMPTVQEARLWRLQEALTFAYIVLVAARLATGAVPWHFAVRAYGAAVVILLLNSVRTLGAHRYRLARREATFVEQMLDSVNYPRRLWTAELWAPLGMRYHALHHLFPSMPYHNLGIAHERLMEQLPAGSPYRGTESPGLGASIRALWAAAGDRRGPRGGLAKCRPSSAAQS